MKCKNWKTQISAYQDGALNEADSSEVRRHLASCQECGRYSEELQELSSLVCNRVEGKSPSPFLWSKIERKITAVEAEKSGVPFLDHFRLPRLAYGIASAMILICLATLLQLRGPSAEEKQLLAELDAYTIAVHGNPFLDQTSLDNDNPFFRFESGSVNPFKNNIRTEK
jgi:predicted anti-sigma-YlaC factor YlaD